MSCSLSSSRATPCMPRVERQHADLAARGRRQRGRSTRPPGPGPLPGVDAALQRDEVEPAPRCTTDARMQLAYKPVRLDGLFDTH
jgi:hypothetical protein